MDWPKGPLYWTEGSNLCVSVPFTWDLPEVRDRLRLVSLAYSGVLVGGPAVYLMPEYLSDLQHVTISKDGHGILQRANPFATRTTVGCIRKCGFCGVHKFEGAFQELDDWPDRPIICDNNLLAASQPHFDRVIDRLKRHGWADFNQGIDSRLLTQYHADRIAEIKQPMVRLALDNIAYADKWEEAYGKLRKAGIAKYKIRSYAIVGFDAGPDEAWSRCQWVEDHGIKVLPMWFHPLDALQKNRVSPEQELLGWSDYERRKIMQWFYKHKEAA